MRESEEEKTARFVAATKELLRYAVESKAAGRQSFETRRIREEGPFFFSVVTDPEHEIRTLLKPLPDANGLTVENRHYLDKKWQPGNLWAVTRAGMGKGELEIEEEVEGGWIPLEREDFAAADKAVQEFTGLDELDLSDLLGLIAFRAALQWGDYKHLSRPMTGPLVSDGQVRASAFML